MEHPREILVITLLLGFGVILLGMLFSGLEAYWRGEMGRWMLEGAPVIALYLCAALAFVWPPALVLMLGAALWYLLGVAVLCRVDARLNGRLIGRNVDDGCIGCRGHQADADSEYTNRFP